MRLGSKTLLILALASIVSIGISFLVLRGTIYPTFVALEDRAAQRDLKTARSAILAQLRELDVLTSEYSDWDATFEFMERDTPSYLERNFDDSTPNSLNIDAFLMLEASGSVRFGVARGADGETVYPTRLPFDELEAVIDRLSAGRGQLRPIAGLLQASGGPLLLAARPIVRSDGTGSAPGSIVLVRQLGTSRIDTLRDQLTVDFSAMSSADETLESALSNQISAYDGPVTVRNPDEILSYATLPDISGQSPIVLKVTSPRSVSSAGASAIALAMGFLTVTTLLYLLASNISIKRLIVRPLGRITEHVAHVESNADLAARLSSDRPDELGVLSRQIDSLVGRLDEAQTSMAAARDAALQASQAKSQFLANMSHEIRTPINGVLGMTELLLNSKGLEPKQRRYAETVHQSGESLLRIINDILDISKIEAGKLELDLAPFNLRTTVEDCLELLAESAHLKRIELIGAVSLNMHTYVYGDSARLRQILTNLVGNAIKFTESGEVVVRVEESASRSNASTYRFEVSDTGIGVPAAISESIFEPFSQADGTTTRRFGGTGLGLSICKQLVDLMGGEIGVESVPGDGSTFWFTIDLKRDEETSKLPHPGRLVGARALVVDDNATNREILRHQLENWGMLVEEAASGPEALRRLQAGENEASSPDLVLLDYHMPDMDGIELAKTLRKLPAGSSLPMVMLSSASSADVTDERQAARLDAWLTKPVRQRQLFDSVLSLLVQDENARRNSQRPVSEPITDTDSSSEIRVLLVEDNPVNQAVTTGMLELLGHRASIACNGSDAVSRFQSEHFDLVLMDCRMPEMDGFEATRSIRQWEREQHREPARIVALTANALAGDRDECLAAGMDDYLSKPFTLAQLRTIIESCSTACCPVENGNASSSDDNKEFCDTVTLPARSKGHVLIADDNVVNQQVVRAMLSSLGYTATAVSDGTLAMDAMKRWRFDLVLMDCHMPVLDGYETTRKIRELERQDSTGGRVPIVALTADIMESNREKCFDCGMDDYLTKPCTQQQLQAVLARCMDSGISDSSEAERDRDEGETAKGADVGAAASIDRQVLAEIQQLDPGAGIDVLREIVLSYCAVSTQLIVQLRNAVREWDAEVVEVAAHSLKGASAQIGATLLAAHCEEIIANARKGVDDQAALLCERACIEHAAVVAALDEEVQRMAA